MVDYVQRQLNDAVFAHNTGITISEEEAKAAQFRLSEDVDWRAAANLPDLRPSANSPDLRLYTPSYQPTDSFSGIRAMLHNDTLALIHRGNAEAGITFGFKDEFREEHQQFLQRRNNKTAGLYWALKF